MTKSTGRQRKREQRWRKLVADRIDAIVAMVQSGLTLAQACKAEPEGPNYHAVLRWLQINPSQNERIRAARTLAGGCARNGSRYSAVAWEAALRTVATDERKLSPLRIPGQPHIDELRRRASRDPAFAERLQAAFDQRNARQDIRPTRFNSDAFARAVDVLQANPDKRLADMDAELRALKLPALGTIYGAKYRRSDVAQRYAEITAARGVKRYSDEAYDEALSILKDTHARSILKEAAGRLPSFGAIKSKALTNSVVASIFDDARTARRAARARIASQRPPKVKYREHVLRSGLLLDELYREADALFHLDGELAREDMKTRGKKVGWAFINRSTNRRLDSLDRSIMSDGGGASLGEFLTSDQWLFEGAI